MHALLSAIFALKMDWYDLSGNAVHYDPGHRCDGAPFRVIEGALWVIQTGQGTDLILGINGLVGRLKKDRKRDIKKTQSR